VAGSFSYLPHNYRMNENWFPSEDHIPIHQSQKACSKAIKDSANKIRCRILWIATDNDQVHCLSCIWRRVNNQKKRWLLMYHIKTARETAFDRFYQISFQAESWKRTPKKRSIQHLKKYFRIFPTDTPTN